MDERLDEREVPHSEEANDMSYAPDHNKITYAENFDVVKKMSQERTSLVFSSSDKICIEDLDVEVEINIPGSLHSDDGSDSVEGFPRDENEEETPPSLTAWFRNGEGAQVLPGAFPMPGTDGGNPTSDQQNIGHEQIPTVNGGMVEAYLVGNHDVAQVAIAHPLQADTNDEESVKFVSHDLKRACNLLFFSIVSTIILVLVFFLNPKHPSGDKCEDFHVTRESSFDSITWEQMGQAIQGIHEDEYVGSSVSMCANAQRIAIGSFAYFNQYAKIYDYVNGTWEIAFDFSDYLPLSEKGRDDGSTITEVSFSDDCKRVAIGIPSFDAIDSLNRHPNGMLDRGIFIVFEFNEETKSWSKLGDIGLEMFPFFAHVGHSITISGDGNRVAFGKYHKIDNRIQSGISIFELQNTTTEHPSWELIFFQPVHVDFSLSLDYLGTMLAVGLPMEESNNGQVNIYNITSNEKIQTFTGYNGDMLGSSVIFSNEDLRLAVGTKLSTNKPKKDYVKIYDYDPELKKWAQIGQNLCGGNIDLSLSRTGDYVAIGTRQYENQETVISVYKLDESTWTQVGRDIRVESSDGGTALSISLSGDGKQVAYGAASLNNIENGNKGMVQVYEANF